MGNKLKPSTAIFGATVVFFAIIGIATVVQRGWAAGVLVSDVVRGKAQIVYVTPSPTVTPKATATPSPSVSPTATPLKYSTDFILPERSVK